VSRLVRIVLLAVIAASSLVLVTAPGANAITCVVDKQRTFTEKRCKAFDMNRDGARATDTYSSYIYDDKAGNDNISANVLVVDTKADGVCAWVRVDKYHYDAQYLNSKQMIGKACGTGKTKRLGWVAIGNQMPNHGSISMWLCTGKKGCTRFWRQVI
jgi:hypothetical protein